MKITKQTVELIRPINYYDAVLTVCEAGGICYSSEKNDKISQAMFIEKLIKMNHCTPLEHVNISFKIATDRMTHVHLIRHRLASFNVESTRYNKYDEPNMILPVQFQNGWNGIDKVFTTMSDSKINKYRCWYESTYHAFEEYKKYLSLTNSTDEARILLPNSIETKMIMTANIREWRHIIKLRCDNKAHIQTRNLIGQVRDILVKKYPIFFEDTDRPENYKYER